MMDIAPPLGFVVYLLLLAPFVGSFIAVIADRLPRGESIVRGRSRCRSCGVQLGWRELVPFVSRIVQRGECRHCGAAIPAWLALSEALAVLCVGLAAIASAGAADFALVTAILWVCLALGLCDALWMRLPDPLVAALLLLALGRAALPGGIGFREAIFGGLLGFAAFWAIRTGYHAMRKREGMGFGDVKLMAALGALCGPFGIAPMTLLAALLGLLWALLSGRRAANTPIPFGLALLSATVCLLLWPQINLPLR